MAASVSLNGVESRLGITYLPYEKVLVFFAIVVYLCSTNFSATISKFITFPQIVSDIYNSSPFHFDEALFLVWTACDLQCLRFALFQPLSVCPPPPKSRHQKFLFFYQLNPSPIITPFSMTSSRLCYSVKNVRLLIRKISYRISKITIYFVLEWDR